jgi:hypothetical protein
MAQHPRTSSDLTRHPGRLANGRVGALAAQSVLAWPRRWRHARQDAQVREWKDAWRAGARARWAGQRIQDNPYNGRSARQSAWLAGWHWAEQQPDRRTNRAMRFAHPLRRSSDTQAVLMRRGAVGLSLFAVVGWLWRGVSLRRTRAAR